MGMMDSGSLLPVTVRNVGNIHLGEFIDTMDFRMPNRTVGKNLKNSSCVTQVTNLNTVDGFRIEALKEDIMYFRRMLEQMVPQKTKAMDYGASILKSCNSTLGGNYHKMHKKYLDLLNKTQAHEAAVHLRALEGELAMLIGQQASEMEMNWR
jgi:hypothetical protein